jgi:sulfate/thiosulfate ABC transporter, ATP-binding protein
MNINIRNLTKKYGKKEIFKNFSLEIETGKVTALMGKSGFGKTTLIRILMGLEKYDEGKITGLENQKISTVFQEDRLCENLSAITNISIVCEKETSIREISVELEKIGLKESQNKPVKTLSGGMKRRVAIIRCIMAKSDIIIFDEPLKGLDEITKKNVIRYLKEKIRGKTVIIVTHDIEEARQLDGTIVNLEKFN